MTVHKNWEQAFKIHTFQVDPKGKAHLFTICNYLQEAASMHATMAGLGFDDMIRKNQVWVLTRLKVMIERYPVWNETLNLETWSRGNEGIFYLRDFIIMDEKKQVSIKATSSWAAINLKTRKPELVDGLEMKLYSQKEKIAHDTRLKKLPELGKLKLLREYKIQYTDIDIVYHVNNVKYIELIINSFPAEKYKARKVNSLEVNYIGETKYDEVVQIFYENLKDQDDQLVSVLRKSDGREVCRARLRWS